jgi:hypothetical protein
MTGELDPVAGFMTGRLRVSGDMSVALKLQTSVLSGAAIPSTCSTGERAMAEALIYDHVRTPRGRGQQGRRAASGHARVAAAHRCCRRCSSAWRWTRRWWTTWCSAASRRWASRAADIARTAVLDAGWAQTRGGVTQSPLLRQRAWKR